MTKEPKKNIPPAQFSNDSAEKNDHLQKHKQEEVSRGEQETISFAESDLPSSFPKEESKQKSPSSLSPDEVETNLIPREFYEQMKEQQNSQQQQQKGIDQGREKSSGARQGAFIGRFRTKRRKSPPLSFSSTKRIHSGAHSASTRKKTITSSYSSAKKSLELSPQQRLDNVVHYLNWLMRKFVHYYMYPLSSSVKFFQQSLEALAILEQQEQDNAKLVSLLKERLLVNIREVQKGQKSNNKTFPLQTHAWILDKPCEIFVLFFSFLQIFQEKLGDLGEEKDFSKDIGQFLQNENPVCKVDQDKECQIATLFHDVYHQQHSQDYVCLCYKKKKVTKTLETVQYILEEVEGYLGNSKKHLELYAFFSQALDAVKKELQEIEEESVAYERFRAAFMILKQPILTTVHPHADQIEWSKLYVKEHYILVLADQEEALFLVFFRFLFILISLLEDKIEDKNLLSLMRSLAYSLREVSAFYYGNEEHKYRLEGIFDRCQQNSLLKLSALA